jgi:hypothetical protein
MGKKNPSLRQKRLAEKIAENLANGGKTHSLKKLLKEAGYSDTVAKNPDKVLETKTFQDLLTQYLPENKIAKVHKEVLGASAHQESLFPIEKSDADIKKIIRSVPGAKVIQIDEVDIFEGEGIIKQYKKVYYTTPAYKYRLSAVDMAHKLRGTYAPEKHEVNSKQFLVSISVVKNQKNGGGKNTMGNE